MTDDDFDYTYFTYESADDWSWYDTAEQAVAARQDYRDYLNDQTQGGRIVQHWVKEIAE